MSGFCRGCIQTTHGMSNTRLYTIWNSMRCRCDYPATNGYARYGGRGIKVCEEWKRFEPFMEWALENGYSDELTLDRIDNDKGYSPENCRWATHEEQCNHQRTNRNITCNGETHTLMQWSRITGLSYVTISDRLEKGMSVYEALFTTSTTKKRPVVAINESTGELLYFESSKEAERCGHTRSSIWRVIKGEYKTHHGYIWKYANEVEN